MGQAKRYEADERLYGLFVDLLMDRGATGIVPFCQHVGLDMPKAAEGWWPAFYAHYLAGKAIDESRVAFDLSTFPPIASRVMELRGRAEIPAGHA